MQQKILTVINLLGMALIIQELVLIKKQNTIIMSDLTALQSAVEAETTIDASVEKLLTTLASELAEANANNDQAAIDAIVTKMKANATALSAAAVANTPAGTEPTDTTPADSTDEAGTPAGDGTATE